MRARDDDAPKPSLPDSDLSAIETPPGVDRRAFMRRSAVIGAAWTGFMIASNEIPTHRRVDFDTTVAAMELTANEMNVKYKETSEGGLAVSVVLC